MEPQTLDQKCYMFVRENTKDCKNGRDVFYAESIRTKFEVKFRTMFPDIEKKRYEYKVGRLTAWLYAVIDNDFEVPTALLKEFLDQEYSECTSDVLKVLNDFCDRMKQKTVDNQ